ncbi:hypothetical protein ACLOJK_028335 [Asimina triloba]
MLRSDCNWGLQIVIDSEEELRHRSLADRRRRWVCRWDTIGSRKGPGYPSFAEVLLLWWGSTIVVDFHSKPKKRVADDLQISPSLLCAGACIRLCHVGSDLVAMGKGAVGRILRSQIRPWPNLRGTVWVAGIYILVWGCRCSPATVIEDGALAAKDGDDENRGHR